MSRCRDCGYKCYLHQYYGRCYPVSGLGLGCTKDSLAVALRIVMTKTVGLLLSSNGAWGSASV